MGFIRKFRYEIVAAIGIISLFFILRLYLLSQLPIFTDEAIYLRWAQIALNDASWRFISLIDGKQPLFVWFTMVMMKFVHDPLLSGRLVSVISGFFTMIGLWFVAYELFKNKRVSFFSSLLYVCYPFAQVYDRMALYDSVAGLFTIWALYFSILLVRKVRLDIAYTLGFTIGLGVLNKSTNFFSIYLLPFTLILLNRQGKYVSQRFIKWCLFVGVAVIIAQAMYAILRLSPLFTMVSQKNALFIYPFSEWIQHPFTYFWGDLTGMTHWLYEYLKLPYVLLILGSLFIPKYWREKILLVLYFLLPFLSLALFARILFPRFIFFMTLSLLPLAALSLDFIITWLYSRLKVRENSRLIKNALLVVVVIIFIIYPLSVSFTFATDPVHSAIAAPDRAQYTNHWTAGWGVKESVIYLREQARDKKIFIGTEGTFGLMPFALELYLVDNPNVKIQGYWPLNGKLPEELIKMSKKMPTFILFYQPNNIVPPEENHLSLLQKTREGDSSYYLRLYKIVGY